MRHVFPLRDVRYGEPGGLLFPLGARLVGGQLELGADGRVVALNVLSDDAARGRELDHLRRRKAPVDLHVHALGRPTVVLRSARFHLHASDEGFELVLQEYESAEEP